MRRRSLATSDASLAKVKNVRIRRYWTYPVMITRTLDSGGVNKCRSMTAVVYNRYVSNAGIRQRKLIQACLGGEIPAVPKMDWLATLCLPERDI